MEPADSIRFNVLCLLAIRIFRAMCFESIGNSFCEQTIMTKEETFEKIVEISEGGWPCEILDKEDREQIMILLSQFENTVIGNHDG